MKFLIVSALLVSSCYAFRYGAPIESCTDMFPTLHGHDAQTSDPPFTITVSPNHYKGGDSIQVFVDAEDKDPDNPEVEFFIEGILMMARKASDDCPTEPVGTWEVDPCDDFVQVIDCFPKQLDKSAIRHYTHIHCFNTTVTWKAPAEPVGHVYIVATIARNRERFWMNVQSPVIADDTATAPMGKQCAPLKTKYVDPNKTNSAIHIHASVLTILFAMIGLHFA